MSAGSAVHDGALLAPRDAADVVEIVARHPRALEVAGGGSKRAIGRPVDGDLLDLRALSGIVSYEPAELVLTARAATPLAEISAALAAHDQRLAFEPPDLGRLLGAREMPTLGGVLAANLAGSRRVSAGAARDHFLGCIAVTGRGELIRAGGRVVKNVTGYDVPKILAGSWGTLAVLTEVTVRVAPAPEAERTLVIASRTPSEAVGVLTAALGSPHDVSAAAFDPQRGALLRLEGFVASVEARAVALRDLLAPAAVDALDGDASRALWTEFGAAATLAEHPVVWRVSVPPADAPRVVAALEAERYLLDWGGGLILAAYREVDAARVRGAFREGHATLFKAPRAARLAVATFQPRPPELTALAARVKHAFDPNAKLNPQRLD